MNFQMTDDKNDFGKNFVTKKGVPWNHSHLLALANFRNDCQELILLEYWP